MNEHSHVRIESAAFAPGSVYLIDLSGRETISQLFEFHAQVICTGPAGLDVDALIGAPAVLVFERAGVEVRRLGGLVAGIRDSMHEETGRLVYDLWFAPRAFRMGLVETYEIFMDVSVPDIVKKKLERAGLAEGHDYEFRLTESYPPREFVVQYKETDLAFVSRLLEHLGVSFFFEHKEGVDVFVLADDNHGFAPVVDKKEVPFRARGERLGVFSIESRTRMTPAQYVVKDYNYRTPQLALQASAPTEKGDGGYVMEYGAHFKNPDEGAQIARIRAEELTCGRTVLDGKSDRHGFSAGAMFLLEEHPRGDMELLLTEVQHRAATSTLGAGKEAARDYENSFRAIPYKTPYRPPRLTPKPRIHGVITGVIDAAAKGPYAELDADGRYRVRFLFDAGDAGEGQASRLCRMAQPHGGGGYGMHFPLRSGVEVILTFVEGDPDRPIILGVVPNPQTPSPVTAGNGTRNVIRTGGGNEINLDDTAGAERIKLSTPYAKSSIQIGEKNCPEKGIVQCTDEHASTNAKQSINFASSTFNGIGDYYRIKSAWDMTAYCTPFINVMAMVQAATGAAGSAMGLAKAGLLEADEQWIKSAGEVADGFEAEAREKRAALAKEKERLEGDSSLKETKRQRDEKQAAIDARSKEREKREAELERQKRERDAKIAERKAKESRRDAKERELETKKAAAGFFGNLAPATDVAVLESEIGGLNAEISRLDAEIAKLDGEIAKSEQELARLDSDSKESQQKQDELEALDKEIADAEAEARKLDSEAQEADQKAETAKSLADERKKVLEESWSKKGVSAIESFVEKVQASPLISTATAIAGYAAQVEAEGKAEVLHGFASSGALKGRVRSLMTPVTPSPKYIGGATLNASLVGGDNAFLGAGRSTSLYGGINLMLVSGVSAAIKAMDAEVYGTRYVYLTSLHKMDLRSTVDVAVRTEQGDISINAAKKGIFSAREQMNIAGSGILVTSKEDLKVVVKKGPTSVTANEGNMTLEAKAGDVTLQAREKASTVTLNDGKAAVAHKDWGVTVQKDRIDIGKHARKNEDIWLTDKTITAKRGGGLVNVANNNVSIKGGNSTVTLASSGCVVNGKRIDLG